MRLVVYRPIPGMIAIWSHDGLATTAHRSHVPKKCAPCDSVPFSTANCCNCLTFLGPLPLTSLLITSQMCSMGLRSGERDGHGRIFTLLACKSALVVRAERQGAPFLHFYFNYCWKSENVICFGNEYPLFTRKSWEFLQVLYLPLKTLSLKMLILAVLLTPFKCSR